MTSESAYEHAQSIFGREAAVWSPRFGVYVVGRWVALSELADVTVGVFRMVAAPVVLRTGTSGLQVLGEGKTWGAAFNNAHARTKTTTRSTRTSKGKNR